MTSSDSESPQEISIAIPGLRLAARAWGPEDGAPVLGLHGWLDNAATFDRLAPRLSGVRLVALDLPGHGLSEHRPAAASYDFVYWLPDVIAAADALGWERFAILGHSMGAMIGSCLAGVFPGRVERLVLVDGLGPLVREAEDLPRALGAAIEARREQLERCPEAQVYPDRETLVARLCRALSGLSEEAARVLVARGVRDVEGGVSWRYDARLRGPSMLRLTEEQVRALLRAARCPILLIRPRQGWPIDAGIVEGRLAQLADARLVEVDGGHHVHLVDPQRIDEAVRKFLAGAEIGRSE